MSTSREPMATPAVGEEPSGDTPVQPKTRSSGGANKVVRLPRSAHLVAKMPAGLSPKAKSIFLKMMVEIEDLRGELELSRARIHELEELADSDVLLPVSNRRAFVRELSRAMSYAERYLVPTSILFFDVDGLKAINDRHGHAAGDSVLLHVVDQIRQGVRKTDVVGRLGGDEFGAVLSHAAEDQARRKAERISAAVAAQPIMLGEESVRVTISIGVHSLQPGEAIQDVLAAADSKMYRSKHSLAPGRAKAQASSPR